MRINTNIAALNAQRNLTITQSLLAKSLERLSSGYRINRAADDAAGLAISEKLRSQVRGLNQAIRNSQDAVSLIQTAEGALNEVHGIIQRMRELAVQAANDTLTAGDRTALQTELDNLLSEVDRIANNTEFNTKKLLQNNTTFTFQVGPNAAQVITVAISAATTSALGISGIKVDTLSNASSAIVSLDYALTTTSEIRGKLGAAQNRLEFTIANLGVASENLAASESRIRDADMALEMVAFSRSMILQQAGAAMLAQANVLPQVVLQLLR
ncbi:MAG: flagellin [Armatimonadota bacterium]|nr:flagellin [Armatimonadota bacterium]